MNGMFAFAIWDSVRRTLFLARDRMGVKPLYYVETPQAFAFASEIKSLFASGLAAAECRQEALAEYMLFRQVAGSDTMFRGVKSLPPGCTMTVRDGRSTISRFWSPRPPDVRPAISHDEALRTFASLLEDSVRLRLVSDVPVGTFCSGGVDSSSDGAGRRRRPVNTFSVGFGKADRQGRGTAGLTPRGTIIMAQGGSKRFSDCSVHGVAQR
jgi:asparagine synthase (glutamine-hydrolysing)